MKKLVMMMTMMLALLMGANALADGPVLMVELPEDAQMIENVQFEDGDFIQTYQLAGGVRVQILRYAAFDMTLEDLAEGEWTGYIDARAMAITEVSGCPAQGLRLQYTDDAGAEMTVCMIMVQAQGQTLLFTAVFPAEIGEAQIEAEMNAWLNTMCVSGLEDEEVG